MTQSPVVQARIPTWLLERAENRQAELKMPTISDYIRWLITLDTSADDKDARIIRSQQMRREAADMIRAADELENT